MSRLMMQVIENYLNWDCDGWRENGEGVLCVWEIWNFIVSCMARALKWRIRCLINSFCALFAAFELWAVLINTNYGRRKLCNTQKSIFKWNIILIFSFIQHKLLMKIIFKMALLCMEAAAEKKRSRCMQTIFTNSFLFIILILKKF